MEKQLGTSAEQAVVRGDVSNGELQCRIYFVGFGLLTVLYLRRLASLPPPDHWRPAILASLCLIYSFGMLFRVQWCYRLLLVDQLRMIAWNTLQLVAKLCG